MKIKYEVKDNWRCVTPCPHGIMNGYTGFVKNVGSNSCSLCTYFVSDDEENKTIECDYGNEKMAKIASIAAMMAIANANCDDVYDIPLVRPKKPLSKGESKKCKSCEFFKGCPERPAPMQTACGNYKRKKK